MISTRNLVSLAFLCKSGAVLIFAASAVLATAIAASARPATDVPFRDGPGTAHQIAKKLNAGSGFSEVVCFYRRPFVKCNGFQQMKKSTAYTGFAFTFHKTAARRGFVVRCYPLLMVCKRENLTYAR